MRVIREIMVVSAAIILLAGIPLSFAQDQSSVRVQAKQGVVDANGDGICDITGQKVGDAAQAGRGQQANTGRQNGRANGSGNLGDGPKDGTGYGSMSGKRMGPQDGTQARMGQGAGRGAGGQQVGSNGRRGGRR